MAKIVKADPGYEVLEAREVNDREAVECGREWRPATSSGGVPIEISRIRARALVEAA